jgi:hypothetical protein
MKRSGVPQLIRSGHANRNTASSGEDDLACWLRVFPTTQNQPHLSMVTTAPANAQRSTLASKAPAHIWFSHQIAQTHRPSNRIESATLSHVRKNPFNMQGKMGFVDYVFWVFYKRLKRFGFLLGVGDLKWG